MSKRRPTIYAVAGPPASGKTTFVANGLDKGIFPKKALWHDCDAVMVQMPEYQEDRKLLGSVKAFQKWELPARELAERALFEAVLQGRDIIYDRSCALIESYEFLKALVNERNYR